MEQNDHSIWVIAYIIRDHIGIIEKELNKYGFSDVEAYVPTVQVLKKKFKGEDHFDEVPLLFNYGFFKIPSYKVANEEFMIEMRQKISALYGWVKDLSKVEEEGSSVAIATDKEVKRMVKASKARSIYSADDLSKLSTGETVLLHGYPFDNMPARIEQIIKKRMEVKITLLSDPPMPVTVNFANVFYSVYNDYEVTEDRHASLEEIQMNNKRTIDKLEFKSNHEQY